MFTNKQLKNMIVPLFFEQFLVMLVGIADTFIVSQVGEAAVSGVSLVNQFNTIFIYLFTALASGGAVVISQYIGSRHKENIVKSSSQLLMFSTIFSIVLSVIVLIFNESLLRLLFGSVESEVMASCVTYLRISAYSYPFMAIYNAGAALYRSMSKTKVTMYISLISNMINIVGNCIGVFILKAGVAGVAYPSLIARMFSAIAITYLCFNTSNVAYYTKEWLMKFDGSLLKKILNIAIPNGIENGVFQLVKVALSSVVALFGTYQIAANGVAQTIWSMAALMGVAMSPVFTTVIGQCLGAGKIDEAKHFFNKLLKLTLVLSIAWNLFIIAITPLFLQFYNLSSQTKELIFILVIIHGIFNAVVYPFFGPLGNGLRAAGDIKYTMFISIFSTIFGRLVFSFILAVYFNLGVIGIAFAMAIDWSIRGGIFYFRYKSDKWTQFKVI